MPLPNLTSVSVPATVTLKATNSGKLRAPLPATASVEPAESMDIVVHVKIRDDGPVTFKPGTKVEFQFKNIEGAHDLPLDDLVLERNDCPDEPIRVPIVVFARMKGKPEFNKRTVNVRVKCP